MCDVFLLGLRRGLDIIYEAKPQPAPEVKPCEHRRLSQHSEIVPVGPVWKCNSCGALIPESAIAITPLLSPAEAYDEALREWGRRDSTEDILNNHLSTALDVIYGGQRCR